ncbi:glycoside hydrolase N-terminal domain-containing protein [bacterium]|nr:glycoside hydrolase N-terminal domain-containing protein [bacterium]
MELKIIFITLSFIFYGNQFAQSSGSAMELAERLKFNYPEHGFVSSKQAGRWEESMIVGNGTIGALVPGNPKKEHIILSHEKLFMPEYPPTKAPDIGKYLPEIRNFVLKGEDEKASELAVEAGREAGINKLIWTDPLVPACRIDIEPLLRDSVINYARAVNYEAGEAVTAWKTQKGVFHRRIFVSRTDSIIVLQIYSPDNIPVNIKVRLSQLPTIESERENDIEEEFDARKLVESISSTADDNGLLKYTTVFKKKWKGSLKGFCVESKVFVKDGSINSENGWIYVHNAEKVTLISKIKLSYKLPVKTKTGVDRFNFTNYDSLLKKHVKIHSEMFNRFQLSLGPGKKNNMTSVELLNSSSHGRLSRMLVEKLCEAARYELICSTGELPPTLQGIWGGTWRPAWSGDFTHNGNVPSAIASGFDTNFIEVMDAYINYMFSMFNDFKANAKNVYGIDGIFCLSRSSSSGSTYHYLIDYPHMYWFAGAAWAAEFFYEYWQYTDDTTFLKTRTIPFMLEAVKFYQGILTKDQQGKYMFIPSYSPENAPLGYNSPVTINATMDVSSLKQLLRNLLTLVKQGWILPKYKKEWKEILTNLPAYEIDNTGDLKEWLYPGYKNNNMHRHASHLYPLFYEVDPDFELHPELKKAAVQAIENRLKYRRDRNGGEMAFGLVQLGLAAAHIKDTEHAYECVDWLCNSYWSNSFTSFHNPGEIFNVDISGGLPAVVAEMIIQSSPDEIELLPALPEQWPEGGIKGVRTRCGVTVDFKWDKCQPVEATFKAQRGTVFKLKHKDREWKIELPKNKTLIWEMN